MTWPVDGGEMGDRIRQHDWASTNLGRMQDWPQSLKTAVDLMLASPQPVLIAWGDEHVVLFNDGYLPIMGDKQPWALGTPMAKVWQEIWEEYRPLIDGVMAGQACFFQDRPVAFAGRQHGWFTFSFAPLRDETARVRGMFNVAVETTEKVLADQALIDSMTRALRCSTRFSTTLDARATFSTWGPTKRSKRRRGGRI